MNKNIKNIGAIILLVIFTLVLSFNTVYASTKDVTLEKVQDNICEINLEEDGKLTKKLINVDNENKEVILQIDVTNLRNKEETTKNSEILLVIDNSRSMTENKLESGKTRKEVVFSAAKELADKMLKEQSTTKIGVVSFSSNIDISKEGTLEDAKLIVSPTNEIEDITTAIDKIETTGGRTNIDAGVQIAKNAFSSDTNLNKYLILLTDGVPNVAVGGPILSYSGEVKTKTKSTLKSVIDNNINLITVMTGVDSQYKPDPDGKVSADAANKTFKDLAEEIFGTQEKPNYGRFYYVTDEKVEDTIIKDVYSNIKVVKTNEIKNIVVVDYFPDNIIENYNFEIIEKANIGEVTATVNTENNSITWNIETLKAGETASFKYKLKLKENFNENIVNIETPTNKKVDVKYISTDEEEKTNTSDISPSIILKRDNTVAPEKIPQTGDKVVLLSITIILLIVLLTVYTVKYKKIR